MFIVLMSKKIAVMSGEEIWDTEEEAKTNKDTEKKKKKTTESFCSFPDLTELLGVDMERDDAHDDEREDAAGFTKDFLQRTSLHGLQ